VNKDTQLNSERRIGRVLLVAASSILPAPTHSGNAVVRWGLVKGLAACGVAVGFYSASPYSSEKNKVRGTDIETTLNADGFWFDRPGPEVTSDSVAALDEAITQFRPDVVLTYGVESLLLVRSTCYSGPVGLMSVDLEFLPKLYKTLHFLRFGDAARKRATLLALPQTVRSVAAKRRAVMRGYPRADFIINHAAHHAAWHRLKHGKNTLYVPNPVEARYESLPPKNFAVPPRFLLLGGLAGAATQPGLSWFATRVYPKIEGDILAGRLEIHLAGRSELRTPIIQRMSHVVQRGYIEDLDEEMSRVTAMLVPTPIKLGFRTRILEAYRYGVAVISHSANKAGMPELEHNQNVLLASNGRQFADAILRLAKHKEDAVRLGCRGFEEFKRELNSTVTARRILSFIEARVLGSDSNYCDKHSLG
jgi:glycosyltransferase involved in cell wall biosynthesis